MEKSFPWYDSPWLSTYQKAQSIIREYAPERLAEFNSRMAIFRTKLTFETKPFRHLIGPDKLAQINVYIQQIDPGSFEKQEFLNFGRLVHHDLPYFNQLQHELTPFVSEHVGEEVEPCYNFLSLYTNLGVCALHMDAPEAKWTVDICLAQSAPWPIYFSQTLPWPENFTYAGHDWEEYIKKDPATIFTPYLIEPGDALLFSGSSQWHYRERITRTTKVNFCHLLFLHYIPRGTSELSQPENWAQLFGIEELKQLCSSHKIGNRLPAIDNRIHD